MANDPLSRLASAIGLISHDDEHQRAAAVRGATTLLARHGLDWRDVGTIVIAHLGATPAPTRIADAPQSRPQPEPHRPPPRPAPTEEEDPEVRAWSEWRRARGGGDPPRPRRRGSNEALRHSGVNVPGEVFGRIRLRERAKPDGGGIVFDIDDETIVFGPLAAFPGVIAKTIQKSNGMRIHAKVVASRERNALPRVYAIDVMPERR